jgi:hypothetical protein
MSPTPKLLEPKPLKDATCVVRDIEVRAQYTDVAGFVRVLDSYEVGTGNLHLIVLCDADPIVWRLRLELIIVGAPAPRLTGLTYIGRWGGGVAFMHPPTRAGDEPWKPHQADMTRVKP